MSLAFIALLPQLISAGIATANEIKALLATSTPGLSDAELNTVLQLIVTKAQQHKALADLDKVPPPTR